MKRLITTVILCCALPVLVVAQTTIGVPAIKNYTHTDYNASTEIWDGAQDSRGLLYFGNNDGLLTFDGSYWKTYPLPNKGAVRALAIDPAGRIFVGGQDEVGYFYPDSNGVLKFHSIKNLLPLAARQFADILNIIVYKNEVFFRTVECVFEYNYRQMKTYDAPGGWRMMNTAGGKLWAEDRDEGLHFFNHDHWQACNKDLKTTSMHITGVMSYSPDTVLLATLNKGLYLLAGNTLIKKPTAIDPLLNQERISCVRSIGAGRYAIGTSAKGLFIIDNAGKLLERFSNDEGLQNNNIRSLLLDSDRNLWLGLENGLDFINYNTAVKHIYPDKNNQLKSNAISVYNGRLYIGTSDGLFNIPLGTGQDISTTQGLFTEVPGTKGKVLSLTEIKGRLMMGHQDGSYVVNNNTAEPIADWQGTWELKDFPGTNDVIAGTYTGLQLLQYNGTDFHSEGMLSGMYESLGNLARDGSSVIWATHPYRGVFRFQLSADHHRIVHKAQYTDKSGLPSALNNKVYFIRNQIIVATEKGVYEYRKNTDSFAPSIFYKPVFGNLPVQYLTEDARHNIWFISDQRAGVIDFNKPSGHNPYTVIYFPELAGQTVKGSEFIYPYNADNILIGSTNGIFHLNYRHYVSTESSPTVVISAVEAIAERDSLIFGGYFMSKGNVRQSQDMHSIITMPKHWNSFHFEYSSTLYAQKSNQEYSHKLIGFDDDWSAWSGKTEKDYTNLPYGTYTFSVRVRNNLGNASPVANYTFVVAPAWYQTIGAWALYAVLLALVVYQALKKQRQYIAHQQRRHELEQQRLSYLHSLELDRNEKEIIALKNDKLETELNYKNKELATITMNLVDRGRTMLSIREELSAIIKKLNMPALTHEFRSVFKLLSDIDKKDEDWSNFSLYFDQVHNNFLSVMKAKYPALSPTDLKLCAYLRLNLSSKEIAQLLNISLKGVEISRYRVRKKLNLSTDVNLYNFLADING